MKRFMTVLLVLAGVSAAGAQEARPPSQMDTIKNMLPSLPSVSIPALPALPALSLSALPDLSMLDFSKMGDGIMGEFEAFTQQVSDSLPLLEAMGYEVSAFRVQWGLPPRAKLRLRSKNVTSTDKIAAISSKAPNGMLTTALISGAAEAKVTIRSAPRVRCPASAWP